MGSVRPSQALLTHTCRAWARFGEWIKAASYRIGSHRMTTGSTEHDEAERGLINKKHEHEHTGPPRWGSRKSFCGGLQRDPPTVWRVEVHLNRLHDHPIPNQDTNPVSSTGSNSNLFWARDSGSRGGETNPGLGAFTRTLNTHWHSLTQLRTVTITKGDFSNRRRIATDCQTEKRNKRTLETRPTRERVLSRLPPNTNTTPAALDLPSRFADRIGLSNGKTSSLSQPAQPGKSDTTTNGGRANSKRPTSAQKACPKNTFSSGRIEKKLWRTTERDGHSTWSELADLAQWRGPWGKIRENDWLMRVIGLELERKDVKWEN